MSTTFKRTIATNALKLRVIRQKHAAKVASLCSIIEKATKGLIAAEKKMGEDAAASVSYDYEKYHVMSFQSKGSNESQMDLDGFVTTVDFASMFKTASETAAEARRIVGAEEPPELPYEECFTGGIQVAQEGRMSHPN